MNVIKNIESHYWLGARFIVTIGGGVILGAKFGDTTYMLIGAVIGLALGVWTVNK